MASTISCDAFTWFLMLSVGLVLVAARMTRGNRRPSTGVIERIGDGLRSSATPGGDGCPNPGVIEWGVGCLLGRSEQITNPALGPLTETRVRCSRPGVREAEIPGLEGSARQFEEAIEKIRLRQQGLRRRGES
jgi:hypothetical protein